MNEISAEELFALPENSYELIDVRDEGLTIYGMIPGAIHICYEELETGTDEKIERIPKEKKLVFYCEIGRKTREMEELPSLKGRECLSLSGGYIGYVRYVLSRNQGENEKQNKAYKRDCKKSP